MNVANTEIVIDLNQIIPIVLSSIVSIVAVCVSAYQIHANTRLKFNELYLSTRIKAYYELLDAAAELECDLETGQLRDRRRLLTASQKAQIISDRLTAEVISNFGAVYYDYIEASDAGELNDEIVKDFQQALSLLTSFLREEIMLHDKQKHSLSHYYYKHHKKERCKHSEKKN
ncbi:hypothetical protein ACTQ0G_05480 [Oscillospiraceae bacterium LCP21S3_A1]|jgi:hypothetical protein